MTPLVASVFLLLFSVTEIVSAGRDAIQGNLRLPSEASRFFQKIEDDGLEGTRWAVLVAGSRGFSNYRHQADVCHAYQLLKNGGLKDENIIVFMYDDIAFHEDNPRPGTIINHPDGTDVYKGVPKDYTGENASVENFIAAILGNKNDITGGSGKVVDSDPNDRIFIFYSGHGGPGVLEMPDHSHLFANQLIEVLNKKRATRTYKSLVFYLEACESGSIFEDLLPQGLNIYATTAANPVEDSWATYCPGHSPNFPPEYHTCLGDLYSVSWMEDTEKNNPVAETLQQQYERVKTRTMNGDYKYGSHVMQYGDTDRLGMGLLSVYLGAHLANDNYTFVDRHDDDSLPPPTGVVGQRDADLVYFWDKYLKAPKGSARKLEAQQQLVEIMSHGMHIDQSVKLIGKLLFGTERGPEILVSIRPAGQPLVDDWECLKEMVGTFETHCGKLNQYGMKYMRSFANMCNAGIRTEQLAEASTLACAGIHANV
ncbi:hypothetical protein V6N13_062677 [Hibiscus sabdariffa]|uniref:Legumain prodomain domain-containing protein n=1 Tax=Hibiscus sabdariffa TaxID=183260 RepID=A0ABR2BBU4_9ROSI